MRLHTIRYIFFTLLWIILLSGIAKSQDASSSLFWVDEGSQKIGFTDLSTDETTILAEGPGGLNFLYDIAIDSTSGDVYFVTNTALKVGDPGSNSADLLHDFGEPNTGFRQLTFDTETNAVFLTDGDQRIIYKYDLTSETMDPIITGEDFEGNPWGVGVHENSLYFMVSGTFYKADQDGSTIEMVAENLGNPLEIEIDHESEKVYWRDQVNDVIKRMNLDGTGEEVVAESDNFPPIAFTLDEKNDRLYWLRYSGVLVQSNLDGTGATDTTDIDEGATFSDVSNLSYNPADDNFYWIYDDSAIERQALDDTAPSLAFRELQPTAIGYDAGDHKVFWTDAERGALVMYDFNTQKDSVLTAITGLNNLTPMDVDTSSNRIFVGGSELIAINYDGLITDTLDVNQASSLSGLVADAENQTIYFTDNASSSFGNLKKVNYDGTGLETLIDATLNYSRGLSHDVANNTLYWASGFQTDDMTINRMDLDTENMTTILNTDDGLLSPLGIGLDPENEHIYWSDSETNSIQRANYTGESITTVLDGMLDTPRDIDIFVNDVITSSEDISGIPTKVELEQNYPNPFNPSTNISFRLNQSERVTLTVHDMLGRRVKTLIDNNQFTSGRHTVRFNAGDLSSGVYIYRLETGASLLTKKLTLVK